MEQTTAALFAFRATAAIFNSLLQTEVSMTLKTRTILFLTGNFQICPNTDQDAERFAFQVPGKPAAAPPNV